MRARRAGLGRLAAVIAVLGALCAAPQVHAQQGGATPRPALVTGSTDLLGPGFRAPTGWTLAQEHISAGLARLRFTRPGGADVVVRITPRVAGERAFATTERFALVREGQFDANADPAAHALLTDIVAALRAHDDGGHRLPDRDPERPPLVVGPGASAGVSGGDQASQPRPGIARFASGAGEPPAPYAELQALVAELLLALFAIGLLVRALPTALATLWRLPERSAVFAVLGLATLARLLVPGSLVSMFMGYRQTNLALILDEIPRYGAGGHVLHHVALELLGVDHTSIFTLHRVLSAATLPMLVAWASLACARPGAATAAAVFAGTAPLLVQDAATESNLVPIVLALWSGGWLLWRWLRQGQALDLVAAAPAFGFAMVCRPEQLVVAPGFAIALVMASGERERLRRAAPALAAVGLLLGVLAYPHACNTLARSSELHSGFAPLLVMPIRLFIDNVVLWPSHFPIVTTVVAALGFYLGSSAERRRLGWLWVFLLLWGGVYTLDLPRISVPRLMAGSATIVCALAGVALPDLVATLRARDPARFARRRAWLLALWLLSALVTVPQLLRPSNQGLEEELFRRALALLPSEPACVLRLGDHDPPYGREVHRYHPDYLFRARGHHIHDLAVDPAAHRCRQTYALLGTRCYARDRQTPTEPGPNASCRGLRERMRLRPLWETRAPVQWDDPFDWWRQQEGFVVGVYQVEGPASGGGR